MARKAKELSALEVGRLAVPGLRFVGGVAGLALQVAPSGARSSILRVMIGGKRREMGSADFLAKRSALAAARTVSMTFNQAATAYIAAMESKWSNNKHASQWRNTLSSYVFPVIGKIYVRDIDQSHVMQVKPIWLTKTETIKRLRGRIENVLDWARERGYRSCEFESQHSLK